METGNRDCAKACESQSMRPRRGEGQKHPQLGGMACHVALLCGPPFYSEFGKKFQLFFSIYFPGYFWTAATGGRSKKKEKKGKKALVVYKLFYDQIVLPLSAMRAKRATKRAKDAAMSAKHAVMCAKDAAMCAKDAAMSAE